MVESSIITQLTYHRIYSDARASADWYGQSRFERVSVEQSLMNFAPPAPLLYLSARKPTSEYFFLSAEPGWIGEWHPAPARQFMIVLSGFLEVEVSDGEVKRFGAGDVLLVEDTWGKGHRSRNIGEGYLNLFVVPIPINL